MKGGGEGVSDGGFVGGLCRAVLPKAKAASPNAKFLLVGTMKDYNPVDYSPGTPARIKVSHRRCRVVCRGGCTQWNPAHVVVPYHLFAQIDNAARQIGTKFIATSAKELNPGGNCKNAVDIACLLALFPELRTA